VPVLENYKKLQEEPLNHEQLVAFRTKVSNFIEITKNWSKKSQKSAAHWQQDTPTEMLLRGGHLINFKKKVRLTYVGKSTCGGS
jgi:hypothetical protein